MSKRRAARRRMFLGVLRWFALIVAIAMVLLPMPVGSNAKVDSGDEIVVFVEAAEPVPTANATDSFDLVTLVHTSTYQSNDADFVGESEDEFESEDIAVQYLPLYTEEDAIALAKMAWGEALVTQSDTEIAATMWCALNRFDSDDPYYRNCKSIEAIVRQSGAFTGYSTGNPVDEHILWLAYDVLERWNAEQYGETDVGRVLPAEYLYFHGDGRHNYFRIEYEHTGQYYDWSLESPYES